MVNYSKDIVAALQATGLPVHYEMILKKGLTLPCISYMELENLVDIQTDIADIDIIQYQIKVWANNPKDIADYSAAVDSIMRGLNWTRISAKELVDNNNTIIQKVLTYEALNEEVYTEV